MTLFIHANALLSQPYREELVDYNVNSIICLFTLKVIVIYFLPFLDGEFKNRFIFLLMCYF